MTAAASRPEVVVIAALSKHNRVIGRGYDLPWPPIRPDLKRFKQLTKGHALVMGRTTFESIILQFGRLLPDRRMVVLTSRGALPDYPDVETFSTLPGALQALQNESLIFIGGGARPYAEALTLADRLELTLVEGTYEGDVYFPPYEHLIGSEFHLTAQERGPGYAFHTYQRLPAA